MSITKIKSLLREKNIRVSEKKCAVLQAIIESNSPVNVNELYQRVSYDLPIDLATVYRTVNALKSLKLIREIINSSGIQYYEFINSNNPVHPHFNCRICNHLFCLDGR
ncbi:MAG: transcriptional repressor [Candidatus Latescibacteria bacterium]|nr:transcriptional repressor [Candidatus Latescibacterota bacterium]